MLLLSLLALVAMQPAVRGQAGKPSLSFETLSGRAAAARDAGQTVAAVDLYRQALKLRPAWDEGWWNLGSITYDQDNYPECTAAFRKLVALKPDSSPAWIMAGLCKYAVHDIEGARSDLLQSERLRFEGPAELSRAARLHLAIVLTKTGACEKAIVILTELTRVDHKTAEIVGVAGIAGLRKTWLPSEVPEVDRDRVAKLGDAMATAMEMDFKEAISRFEAVLADYPSDPDIHFRFGSFLMQQTPERGLTEIRRALELDPDHVPALLGLAVISLKNGDPANALIYARKAVVADPGDFASHVALGRAYLDADDVSRAVDELTIAVKLAPDSADAHFSLASAYSRLGRKEDAQREQEAFRRLRQLVDAVHP